MSPDITEVLPDLRSAGCNYRADADNPSRWWAACPACRIGGLPVRVTELPSGDVVARCEACGSTLPKLLEAIDASATARLLAYDELVAENARLRYAVRALRSHIAVLTEIHHGHDGDPSGDLT